MERFKREHPVWYWVLLRLVFCLCASAVLVFGLAGVLCLMLVFITAAYNDQWIYLLALTPVMMFGAYGFLELAEFAHKRF
jgi:hypothetical protein